MRSQTSAPYRNPTPPCRLDQTLLGTHVADAHRPHTSCRPPLRSYELALSFGASMSFYGNSSTKFSNVHHLQRIADNLSDAGWSWRCVSAVDCNRRTIFVADAHRDDGKRFVVRADEKLTAFLELGSVICARQSDQRTAGRVK